MNILGVEYPLLLFVSCDPLAVGFPRGSIGVEERSMGVAPPPRATRFGVDLSHTASIG